MTSWTHEFIQSKSLASAYNVIKLGKDNFVTNFHYKKFSIELQGKL